MALTEQKQMLPLQGSSIYKDRIAPCNDALIDVLEAHGAIVIGKTNTPEFGAGANTFNEYVKLHLCIMRTFMLSACLMQHLFVICSKCLL